MRVKKIELIGFKSFADPTEILLHDGVTCIVGPNGCGKSNVSDAVRWVLGERSAKLLRGGHMQDVIFNGTDFRKPLGMAEVTLVVDNSDRRMPIEYDEVALTRRLYRSGESEYLINRTPCRLKDILDLILDTGMGSNSYSMIEQGRIDYILSADPNERRFLIEEAAGISKYKVKKEEALRKLERTEQNLLRIRDIVAEVRRNIQYAERQAKRAAEYKTQYETLKKLEVQKAFCDLRTLEGQRGSVLGEKEKAEGELAALKARIAVAQRTRDEHQKALSGISAEESRQEMRRFELRSEQQAVDQTRQFNRERITEARARVFEIERERRQLSQDLESLEKEIGLRVGELQEAEVESAKRKQELTEAEREQSVQEAAFRAEKERLEGLKSQLFNTVTQLSALHNELNRLEGLVISQDRDEKRREETRRRLISEKEVAERQRKGYEEELVGMEHGFLRLHGERREAEGSLEGLKGEIAKIDMEVTNHRAQHQAAVSRLKLLEELEESNEEQQRKLLESMPQERLRGNLVQRLREVLTIQKGYEVAVEAVLGAFAQGLIAHDVESAKGLIVEMSKAHIGPCGIFIQSLLTPNGRSNAPVVALRHRLVRCPITSVVKVSGGLEPLFEPFFENVFIVDRFNPADLEELLPVAEKAKLVTKEGILLGPGSRIFFRNGRISSDQGPLHRKSEIETLKSQVAELNTVLESLQGKQTDCRLKIRELETKKEAGSEETQEARVRKEAIDSLRQGLIERLARCNEELRVLEFESTESVKEKAGLEERIKTVGHEAEELETQKARLSEEVSVSSRALETQQGDRERRIQQVAELKGIEGTYREKLRTLSDSEELIRKQIQNCKERGPRLDQEENDLQERVHGLRNQEQTLILKEDEIRSAYAEAEKALSEIRGRKGFQEEGLRQSVTQSSEVEGQARQTEDSLHQHDLRLMELSYQERAIHERLEQSYRMRLAELNAEEFSAATDGSGELEREIENLKGKLESLGSVNLLAVDEYEELKQRYDFLANQENDLNQARESLLDAIRKINRTTKTLFEETFVKVQQSFQEHFHILFGGGHAELVLLEGDENPQEAGIDIIVRPPGKKTQHITLLSGGEKALTALALLFALFRVKPSPFCVLDEVDAPLDEANVDRFIAVLRHFLASTQFLIITHNRKTIAMGDTLYGITMQESGVSKTVSVRVAEERKAVAEEKVAA